MRHMVVSEKRTAEMFASRKPNNDVTKSDISAEAVADLADAVGKGPQLTLAESNIAALRIRRDALRAEEQALASAHRANRSAVTPTAVNALTLQIRGIEKEINATRPLVSELRRARADRVNDALLAIQKDAAARVLAAYADITDATNVLIACNEEVRKAGDPDRPYLNHVAGITLIDHARWLLK